MTRIAGRLSPVRARAIPYGRRPPRLRARDSFAGEVVQNADLNGRGEIDEGSVADAAAWEKHPQAASAIVFTGDGMVRNGSGSLISTYRLLIDPNTANYRVSTTVKVVTNASGSNAGPVARLDPTADTCYLARFNATNASVGAWEIVRSVNGSRTTLVSAADSCPTVGSSFLLELAVSNQEKVLYVDGVRKCATTDNTVAAAGWAGLRIQGGASNGHHIDEFWMYFAGPQLAVGSNPDSIAQTADPTQAPQLIAHFNYDLVTSSTSVVEAGWQFEQEPHSPGTAGAIQDRITPVAAGAMPGSGGFKPSGKGMRVELRREWSTSDITLVADGDVHWSASGGHRTPLTSDVTLPAATVSADTTGFTSTGTVQIGLQIVTYTGVSGSAFTGCTGGTGSFVAGVDIVQGGYNANRAEVIGGQPASNVFTTPATSSDWALQQGTVRWISTYVYFPADFAQNTNYWFTFTQLTKGIRGGSPRLSLEADGDRVELGATAIRRDLGPMARGAWTKFVVGMRLETNAINGWVNVFVNDVEKVSKTYVQTLDLINSAGDAVYLKQGIYRAGRWPDTHVLTFGRTKIGANKSDVD